MAAFAIRLSRIRDSEWHPQDFAARNNRRFSFRFPGEQGHARQFAPGDQALAQLLTSGGKAAAFEKASLETALRSHKT
jgi:hypothetical protein